jgi:hypothetical protein
MIFTIKKDDLDQKFKYKIEFRGKIEKMFQMLDLEKKIVQFTIEEISLEIYAKIENINRSQ